MRQNIRSDLVPNLPPSRQIGFQVELFCCPYSAIKRNPAHDFGIDKMPQASAHLPDTTIGFMPMGAYMFHQHTHHCPQWPFQLFPVALKAALTPEKVNTIEYFTKNVQLLLLRRAIAYTYWTGVVIATQVGQFPLAQIPLTTNAIHDLQIFTIRVRETTQPVSERVRFFGKPEYIERIQGKGRITQPGKTIVPVTPTPQSLRQRSGGRCDNGTGGRICHHFEHKGASFHHTSI